MTLLAAPTAVAANDELPWFPTLMLHRVVDRLPAGNPYNLCITPAGLERVVRRLRAAGREVVALEDAVEACAQGQTRQVASLTFDDGYFDFYSHAWPVLRRLDCPATVFLVSNRLGGSNDWDAGTGLPEAPLLTAAQVHELAAHGIRFGSHGANHRRLTTLTPVERHDELTGSKQALEGLLQQPVRLFAYPYLDMDPAVQNEVGLAGYAAACGGEQPSHHRLRLHRIDLRHLDAASMRFRLDGWHYRLRGLGPVQAAKRLLRGGKTS